MLTFYSASSIKQVEEIINRQGATIEMLFFLDYFKHSETAT